jgi:hypothetical protein
VPSPAGRGRPGPGGQDGDEVTRFLCAGAYRDPGFARDVLDEVLRDPARAVAPAGGVQVALVTQHCLAAVRQSTRTDLALTGIVVAMALLAGVQGILIAIWVFSWALVARALRSLGQGEPGRALSHAGVFVLISVVCLFALLLRGDGAVLGAGTLSVRLPLESAQVLGLVLAALWFVVYLDRVAQYGVLAEQLTAEAFAAQVPPPAGERWRDRLDYVGQWARSPLIIHAQSSATAPFTGYGALVHSWSVPVAGTAGSGDAPVSAQALYTALAAAGTQAGYTVSEAVLASGWLPQGHPFRDQVRGRPDPHLPEPVLREIAAHPDGPESYRQVWSAAGPGSSTAGFIQVAARGQALTVDVALTALPALPAEYRIADSQPPAGLGLMARLLGAALIDVVRRTPQAPGALVRSAARWAAPRARGAGPGGQAAGAGHDLGARAGLREIAARQPGANALNDYEATRQANQLSREVALAVAGALAAAGTDPEPFVRAADAVSQRALAGGSHRAAGTRVP